MWGKRRGALWRVLCSKPRFPYPYPVLRRGLDPIVHFRLSCCPPLDCLYCTISGTQINWHCSQSGTQIIVHIVPYRELLKLARWNVCSLALDCVLLMWYDLLKRGGHLLKYGKFFQLMESKGIKQIDLREKGVHPRTFQKMANGELLRSDTIDQLCRLLDCQPGDIMEYMPDETQDADAKK